MDTTTQESLKNRFSKILLGFAGGVILSLLAFLLFNIFSASNKPKVITARKTLTLSVTSPETNLATANKTITISGSTKVKSIVTLSTSKQSKIVETAGSYFSSSLELIEGKNIITVVAFDSSTGESQTTTKEVLYLNQDLTAL